MRTIKPKEAARHLRCATAFILSEIRAGALAPVMRINSRVILIPEETFTRYTKGKTVTR